MATSEVHINSTAVRQAFFTPRRLAEYLAVSERTLRELLRTGEIPSYKIAGARRIDPADVDARPARRRFARARSLSAASLRRAGSTRRASPCGSLAYPG
jgi:excisionase family DNA binding protein